MIYLYEHHAGFDPDGIGFPSLSGCQGILLQTTAGLYGYHSLGGESNPKAHNRAAGFAKFVQAHSIVNVAQKLYGACFLQGRGYSQTDKMAGWRAEIDEYANAVGCNDVQCIDLSPKIVGKVVKQNGHVHVGTVSAYVEFRLVNGECKVYYKNWSKMNESVAAPLTPTAQEYTKIHQINGALIAPDKAMKPVEIITTRWNKGELHQMK